MCICLYVKLKHRTAPTYKIYYRRKRLGVQPYRTSGLRLIHEEGVRVRGSMFKELNHYYNNFLITAFSNRSVLI